VTAPDPSLGLEVLRAAGRTVVRVTGELDLATADRFRRAVAEALAGGPAVIDLAALEFIDSSGVRALDGVLRDADRDGAPLRVSAPVHENVAQVLDLVGMLDELPWDGEVPG